MIRRIALIIGFIATSAASQTPDRALSQAFDAMKSKDWSLAVTLGAKDGDLGRDIILWHFLRSGRGPYEATIDFLNRNPDWPGLPYLMRRSEKNFAQAPSNAVLAFFDENLPQTAQGSLIYARALEQSNQANKAKLILQNAWLNFSMDTETFDAIVSEFGSYVTPLSKERLEMVLWKDWDRDTERMLPLVGADLQALAKARIAVRHKSDAADTLLDAVPDALKTHPLIVHARYEFRTRAWRLDEAAEMIIPASQSAVSLGNPEAWATSRKHLARNLLRDGKAGRAYQIAANHFLSEGDDYAELEWLAGYMALTRLNKASDAVQHFERFLFAVDTPISLGRGYYWLGRAYKANGQTDKAQQAFELGADHQTSFYGLLAAEEIGAAIDPSFADRSELPDWRTASFVESSVFRSAILLFAAEQHSLAERFMTHLAETLTDTEILQLADFLEEANKPHVLVMVGKRAASQGRTFARPYFALHPMIDIKWPVKPELSLAISRRESEFDPRVVSPVGAKGLMQLMPKTAEEMAGDLGVPYLEDRLTEDWEYNAALGTTYLAELGTRFNGNPVLMSVAYNAGPSRAEKWSTLYGDPRSSDVDILDWIELIPFEETRNYVMRVTESLPVYRARLGQTALPIPFSQELRGSGLLPLSPQGE